MSYEFRTTAEGDIEFDPKQYHLLKMAYNGSGDFADGKVLLKHDRETSDGYANRKKSVSYANYFRPVIDVAVNAIFSKDATRIAGIEDPQWEAFTKSVDGRNNFPQFMRKAALVAKKLGSAWLFMDNNQETAASVEEAVRDRKLPYMFIVEPQMIKNFTMDAMGNLMMVSYYERSINSFGEEEYAIHEWTLDRVKLTSASGVIETDEANELNVIPCIPIIGSGEDLEDGEIPFPEYLNICQLNVKLVNIDSLLTNGIYQQGFSILLLAGDFEKDLEIGESAAINYDKAGEGTVDAPSFISPDAAPLEKMMEYMEVLKNQIQEQSIADFSTTNSESQSGLAKRIDNINRSEYLENFATYLEQVEVSIAILFGSYIRKDLKFTSEYRKDFDIDDIVAALEQAQKALELGFGSTDVEVAIKRDALQRYFSEKEQEEVNDLVGSLKAVPEATVVGAQIVEGVVGQEPSTILPEQQAPTNLAEVLEALKEIKERFMEQPPIQPQDDAEVLKHRVYKVLYDLAAGKITEEEAYAVLATFGFSTENAKSIVSRALESSKKEQKKASESK